MNATPRFGRTLRERVRGNFARLLAVSLVMSAPSGLPAQDIFAVDAAPKTSVRTRTDWFLRDFHELPDGKLLIVGNFRYVDGGVVDGLVRLLPDGRLDPTFTAPYPGQQVMRAGVVGDGRIIVLSNVVNPPVVQRLIQRLLADGSIDPAFSAFDVGVLQPQAIIGLPDGGAYVLSQTGPNSMRVIRLLPDGRQDLTFNSAPLTGSFINAGALSPAGDLALIRNGVAGPAGLVLIAPDGSMRPPLAGIPNVFRPSAVVFDPVGGLVLSGTSGSLSAPSLALVGIRPDGFLAFVGLSPFQFGAGQSLVRAADGTFFASGPGPAAAGAPAILHFSAEGIYLGGVSGTSRGEPLATATLRPASGGGAYALGNFIELGGVAAPSIARLSADRSVDPGFFVDVAGAGRVAALAPYRDGILLAGVFTEIGERDITNLASFGADDGFAGVLANFSPGTQRGIGTGDGGAVLMGSFAPPLVPGPTATGLLKLRPDGTVNPLFMPTIQQGSVEDAAEQPDGRIVFAGRSGMGLPPGPVLNLFRTNADGTLDATFNNLSPITGGIGIGLTAVAVDAQGRILVAGSFTTIQGALRPGLARLTPTGLVDPSFAPTVGLGVSVAPRQIRLLPDGSFYVAGTRSGQPPAPAKILRFNEDGSLHAEQLDLPDIGVSAYALHPDGSIFIVGGSSAGNGVFRVLPSGGLDPLFQATFDLGTNSPILIDNVGRVLVGGVFGTVNGEPHEGLVRFAPVPFGVAISGPSSHTLRLLDNLTLIAQVSGTRTPAMLRWFHDGEPIAGATGPTLTLTHIVPKHEGSYTVSATGAAGTVTSAPVTVTLVRGAPSP